LGCHHIPATTPCVEPDTPTPTVTDTPPDTRTPTVTPTRTAGSSTCFGDCNGDGQLTAGDLTKMKCIILNCASLAASCGACANAPCGASDSNGDGKLSAGELTHAITNIITFLNPPRGCPPGASPTPTTPVG